jgi:hypothetical protein
MVPLLGEKLHRKTRVYAGFCVVQAIYTLSVVNIYIRNRSNSSNIRNIQS